MREGDRTSDLEVESSSDQGGLSPCSLHAPVDGAREYKEDEEGERKDECGAEWARSARPNDGIEQAHVDSTEGGRTGFWGRTRLIGRVRNQFWLAISPEFANASLLRENDVAEL